MWYKIYRKMHKLPPILRWLLSVVGVLLAVVVFSLLAMTWPKLEKIFLAVSYGWLIIGAIGFLTVLAGMIYAIAMRRRRH